MRIRFLVFFAFISASFTAVSGYAQTVSGRVIDPSGRPLPRAYVHAVASDHSSAGGVFTDSDGRFSLTTAGNCTIEVTLTGFENATAPCSDRPLDLKLELAPVSEHVIVSATRTDMGARQWILRDRLSRESTPFAVESRTAPDHALSSCSIVKR